MGQHPSSTSKGVLLSYKKEKGFLFVYLVWFWGAFLFRQREGIKKEFISKDCIVLGNVSLPKDKGLAKKFQFD